MSNGTYDDMKGRAKEAAGDLTDNDDLRAEGKVDRASGSIKGKLDRVTSKIKAAFRRDR